MKNQPMNNGYGPQQAGSIANGAKSPASKRPINNKTARTDF
jgi:hypothetical protein